MPRSRNPHIKAAAVIQALPLTVTAVREQRGLSIRAAAREIGIGYTTLIAAEQGEHIRSDTVVKILNWIGKQKRQVIRPSNPRT